MIPAITSGESSPEVSEDEGSKCKKREKTSTKMDDVLRYLIDSSLLRLERDSLQQLSNDEENINEILLLEVDLRLS